MPELPFEPPEAVEHDMLPVCEDGTQHHTLPTQSLEHALQDSEEEEWDIEVVLVSSAMLSCGC